MPRKTTHDGPLGTAFYDRPVVTVARELIGCLLRRRLRDGTILAGRIVETEAYRHDDPASHSFRGRTARNESMFGPPGSAYVYLIYGIHTCLNVVCGKTGHPDAVLIRAIEPSDGLAVMWRNRFQSAGQPPDVADRAWASVASGPGNVCRALGVTRETIDGTSLITGPVTIHPSGASPRRVIVSRRVGISKAVDHPWRFSEAGNPHVSRPRPRPETG